MLEIFKAPYENFISQIFLLILFVSLLFALLSTTSGSCNVKQLSLIVFNEFSQGKGCLHWASFESCYIRTALQVGSSREPPDRSNNNSSQGMGL